MVIGNTACEEFMGGAQNLLVFIKKWASRKLLYIAWDLEKLGIILENLKIPKHAIDKSCSFIIKRKFKK